MTRPDTIRRELGRGNQKLEAPIKMTLTIEIAPYGRTDPYRAIDNEKRTSQDDTSINDEATTLRQSIRQALLPDNDLL